RGPDGGERFAARLRSADQRRVRDGDRVRARPGQAGALRRRAAPGAQSPVRRARPRADGDAHPPRAGGDPAARSARPCAPPRGRAPPGRGGIPQAQRGAPRGGGLQLRPQRGGGRPGDRAPRRAAARARERGPAAMTSRRRLLRWAHWFTAVHAGLLALIGLRYLWLYVRLSPTVAWVYAPLAYLGHIAVLAYLPIFLFVLPLILLLPRPRVVVPLGVGLASAATSFLMLDSLVFAENRYHLNILTATLLGPHTWLFLGIYFGLGLAIEGMLAPAVWQPTATAPTRHVGRYVALGLALCFAAANLMHAWFEARYDVSVTSLTRYLPLYFPLRDARIQVRLGLVDRRVARERGVMAAL